MGTSGECAQGHRGYVALRVGVVMEDECIYISGGLRAMDGRLLALGDKAEVVAMLAKICGQKNLEFIGKIGYSYEFVRDEFTTDGPVEAG